MSQVMFKGITVEEGVKMMEGAEVTNISVEHNSCDIALSHYEFVEKCWVWFKGCSDVMVFYDGMLIVDHSPCLYCEMEWGIAHEEWCRTRWED
uniref:Uncharacterized protein n=1 Tax=viral metagenome TaxID=1070528 RepID=A0A6C0I5S5_9ZZZZ